VVLAATRQDAAESAAALETLCRSYWHPLYAYIQRCGQSPHDAQDLTQEFFSRLLEKRWLDSVDRDKGKLRTFLVVALKKFMSNEWRRSSAQRRGGGQFQVPFDTESDASSHLVDHSTLGNPDQVFDREWAVTLLDLTLARLRSEFATAGRASDFEILKSSLLATKGSLDYPGIACSLGLNEGAARVAVHRLRKRFRQIYREEISHTVADNADVEEEMRFLAAALAQK
jgi:RNA polymerase sigma factor (sigma-70 family)